MKPSIKKEILSQKGYSLPILIVLIGLVIIGACGYLLYQKQAKQSQNSATFKQLPPSTTSSLNKTSTSETNSPSIPLTACQEITSSGNYHLSQNIDIKSNRCINIHDVSNVNLDCQNHSIAAGQAENIIVVNVKNFSIQNCNLVVNLSPSNPDGGDSIIIENSSSGIIKNNTSSKGGIRIRKSDHLQILSNTINSHFPFAQYKSTFNQIRDNKFTADPIVAEKQLALSAGYIGNSGADGVVVSDGGSDNIIEDNVIDGSSDGVLRSEGNIGADDGILLAGGEKNIKITGNTIKNNWDCGIENIGPVEDAQIAKNKISNNGVCGIGGWYWNSWLRSVIDSNIVENTPTMFYFYRASGLLNEKDGVQERNVYFQDNTFSNNTFLRPKAVSGKYNPSSSINFENLPPEIPASVVKLGNNVFKNNDFGKDTDSPIITPSSMIIDQKDNKCLQTKDNFHPLECK